MTTKIEWTDETWNPVTGCTPISPGCVNCYTKRMARRLAGRHGYPEAPRHFDVTFHPNRLDQPLRWKKPRRIFVCSMSDLFHEDVPEDFITKVFARMIALTEHTFQVLTKRPDRMLDYIVRRVPGIGQWSNVWLGVTICNSDELWKAGVLSQTPAAVRYVSIEPMLEEIDLSDALNGYPEQCGPDDWDWEQTAPALDQVICGAETGPGKRLMELDWARSLRDQCQEAGIPFFFKRDSQGNHELDGRVWEEFPE